MNEESPTAIYIWTNWFEELTVEVDDFRKLWIILKEYREYTSNG